MISRRLFLGGISAAAVATVAKVNIPIPPLRAGELIDTIPAWVPPGFVIPSGQEYSRFLYQELFAVMGTTYGGGPTTFKLPDCGAANPAPGSIAVIMASNSSKTLPVGMLMNYFVPLQSAA